MFEVSAGIAVLLITLWLIWRRKKFSFFKELGILGPEPSIFFGNFWELSSKGPLGCHKKWIEQYGNIFGYYFGTRPVFVVSDPELLKEILVHDFQKFVNRPETISAVNPRTSLIIPKGLTFLRDKKWKDMRSIISPSFTARKMRLMAPIMNEAIDVLLEKIEEKSQNNEAFDIYALYRKLTMDVISRTAFGIQTNVQKNPKGSLLKTLQVIFSGHLGLLAVITYSFPELSGFWNYLRRLMMIFQNEGKSPVTELLNTATDIISIRKNDNSGKRNDLLQLLIEAEMTESELNDMQEQNLTAGDEETPDEEPKKADGDSSKLPSKILLPMTVSEIVQNTITFLIAGYETTSTALAFSTHLLLYHPEAQEKIRKEVNDSMEKEGELCYTSVHNLQYLDQFFRESLRMYPPVPLFVNRETGEDVTFGNVRIPKGSAIQVPVYALHYDPKLWAEPEKFDPERFSLQNRHKHHPMAWQPFGAGPRNCIGMRFAQMQAKLALAKILQTYKLVTTEETDKNPATLRETTAIIKPAKGVMLKAVRY